MSIMSHFREKSKQTNEFKKLEELREGVRKMLLDSQNKEQEFINYFEITYPGLKSELEAIANSQQQYFTALFENEEIKKAHPEHNAVFKRIDKAYEIDKAVKTGSIEKYTNPQVYNAENASCGLEEVKTIVNSKNARELRKYLKNAGIINKNANTFSIRDFAGFTLFGLCQDANFMRHAIMIQYPHINNAINAYNQHLAYCTENFPEATKERKYSPIGNITTDAFSNIIYYKLLESAFDPTKARKIIQENVSKKYAHKTVKTM